MVRRISCALLVCTFSYSAIADKIIPETPIKKPVNVCVAEPRGEGEHVALKGLRLAQKNMNCGDYQAAYKNLLVSLEVVEQLAAAAVVGYCYSRRNCTGAKVSAQKVTEAQCRATGIGDSWQQTDPTLGTCVNL